MTQSQHQQASAIDTHHAAHRCLPHDYPPFSQPSCREFSPTFPTIFPSSLILLLPHNPFSQPSFNPPSQPTLSHNLPHNPPQRTICGDRKDRRLPVRLPRSRWGWRGVAATLPPHAAGASTRAFPFFVQPQPSLQPGHIIEVAFSFHLAIAISPAVANE